jgi:hypothetical protein
MVNDNLGSKGAKSAYTADNFRRLFRTGFGHDFVKEKILNRTVETFLAEHEQSFALFEYAVELINEVDIFSMLGCVRSHLVFLA